MDTRLNKPFSPLKKGILWMQHTLQSRGLKGFGIHSPFLFHLVTMVINQKYPYYHYARIEQLRKTLKQNKTNLLLTDYGTGGQAQRTRKTTIANIASKTLKPAKQAQLISRLVNHFNPNTILELGTSLGLTTAYMAAINSDTNIISLEGCPEVSKIAQHNLASLNITNVKIITGPFNQTLQGAVDSLKPLDFVFFDGNHSGTATLQYFETCLPHLSTNAVLIFDDIYANPGMLQAWNAIINHKTIRVSLNCFHFGIALTNPNLSYEHFKIRLITL